MATGDLTDVATVTADQPDPAQSNNTVELTLHSQPAAPGIPSYRFITPSQLSNGSLTKVQEQTQWTASPAGQICRYLPRYSTDGGKFVNVAPSPPTATF